MTEQVEDFKVVAVVKFNDSEALVLNRSIRFLYEIDPKDGKSFIGSDGPFRYFLGYGGSSGYMKAFAGRTLHLTMADGSVKDVKDDWWSTYREGYAGITVGNVEALIRCYVYNSAHITPEDYTALRSAYTGTVFEYWDYEKVIKYDSERREWIGSYFEEQRKNRELTAELTKRDAKIKRLQRQPEAIIYGLIAGRSMLMRAAGHLSYERNQNLKCALFMEHGDYFGLDHIGKWKAAGKENGFGECDDEYFEMIECPLCSAQYAAFKARKLIMGRVGRINGILTRMGNGMRVKE